MRQERVHTLRSEWGAVMLFVRLFVGDGVNEGRQLALAPGVIKLQTCVALCLFSLSISLFPPPCVASENVLIHQMFQCKLTQTGSLVPHHQRMKLRGPKGTLLNKSNTQNPARDAKKYVELNKVL